MRLPGRGSGADAPGGRTPAFTWSRLLHAALLASCLLPGAEVDKALRTTLLGAAAVPALPAAVGTHLRITAARGATLRLSAKPFGERRLTLERR